MSLKELLTTYFPQLTLILGGLGVLIFYFIKRYFDLNAKKVETRYAIFQQSRIDALRKYFDSYTKSQRALGLISTGKLVSREYTSEELDGITKDPIGNLIADDLTLGLYFEGEVLEKFNDVTQNILRIHGLYLNAFVGMGEHDNAMNESNYLHLEMKNVGELNSQALKALGKKIRISFIGE